ncbi:MAG: hypothetical protein NTZ95_02370 [Candidatus Omnitrophica bacterium]|nr:hypothetical protein [Candidatus Omnitrophota bacterium]
MNSAIIPQFPVKLPGSFWAMVTFFNPLGHKNKYENYRLFRDNSKRQGLNLLAVELAFDDDPFTLKKDIDAEILIQVRGTREKNLMWQKERLLNIGLGRLPQDCDKVCWADCDIIFKNDDWIKETSGLLEKYVAVQPFEYAAWLPKGVYDLGEYELEKLEIGRMENQKYPGHSYKIINNMTIFGATGFAWVMRKALTRQHLFYENALVGGADNIMAHSFMNGKIPDQRAVRLFSTNLMKADQDMYAAKVYEETQGSVYYTNGSILHLWHGDSRNRLYGRRNEIIPLFAFDLSRDIRIGSNDLYEWSSDKPDLHKAVREYFEIRDEEGKGSVLVPLIIDELELTTKRLDKLEFTKKRLKNIETSHTYRISLKLKRIYETMIPSKKMRSFIWRLLKRK